MRKLFISAAAALLLLGASPIMAQMGMTDAQVIQYVQNGMRQGRSQEQIMTELAARGVTQEQAMRIKQMLDKGDMQNGNSQSTSQDSRLRDNGQQSYGRQQNNRLQNNGQMNNMQQTDGYMQNRSIMQNGMMMNGNSMMFPNDPNAIKNDSIYYDKLGYELKKKVISDTEKVFGRDIFTNTNLSFEPNMNMATPANYRLGPGDEIIIDIWGASESVIRKEISPDGNINIPGLGPIALTGMNIADAKEYLSSELSRIYANEGNNIQVTLGKTRSIKVNVMGEVMVPGTYTLSGFASVFHALYSAGGITELGSLRNIMVAREGKTVATVDVYDYILQGKTQDDISLQENDVIIVPTYNSIVKVEGKVKRPMKYEMNDDETISTLLKYAGYFAPNAYKNSVRVVRQNGRQYSIATVERENFGSFKIMDGDVVSADSIIDNRYSNKLEIKGAVYRPGVYEYCENINTVKKLMEQADGLLGDAFTNRAVLYRQRENLTSEVIQVDVKGIMEGTAQDVELQNNDVLFIPSIYDIQSIGDVYISGEILKPGRYPYADNMTLEDLVITAGGLMDAASMVRVDVSRPIKNNKGTVAADSVSHSFSFGLKDGFIVDGTPGFVLEPHDQVFVRKSPEYHIQKNVTIEGEVLYGGEYGLQLKSERLSSLVKRAGGVTNFAYVKGTKLTRVANEHEKERMRMVIDMMRKELGESLAKDLMLELDSTFTVGINLEEALANPGSNADIVLREGDVISVPEMNNTVKIDGAVMMPNTVSYVEGKNVGYYLDQAGGYANNAKKSKKFIIYMNGEIERVKKRSKKVEPGCEIVVPNKVKTNKIGEVMGYATSFASLATMIASLANLMK